MGVAGVGGMWLLCPPEPAACSHLPRAAATTYVHLADESQRWRFMPQGRMRQEEVRAVVNCRMNLASRSSAVLRPL